MLAAESLNTSFPSFLKDSDDSEHDPIILNVLKAKNGFGKGLDKSRDFEREN